MHLSQTQAFEIPNFQTGHPVIIYISNTIHLKFRNTILLKEIFLITNIILRIQNNILVNILPFSALFRKPYLHIGC